MGLVYGHRDLACVPSVEAVENPIFQDVSHLRVSFDDRGLIAVIPIRPSWRVGRSTRTIVYAEFILLLEFRRDSRRGGRSCNAVRLCSPIAPRREYVPFSESTRSARDGGYRACVTNIPDEERWGCDRSSVDLNDSSSRGVRLDGRDRRG